VRPLGEATIADNAGLSANLRVELADGQTAQATIREQAGSISVKIVTPTAQSALRVSGEIDSLRQNLDAAGVRLGNTEVSYQQGDRGGRNARDYRPTPQPAKSSAEKQPSTFSEVLK
jgi:flagellar hook-length control protein FliK